MVTRHTRFTSRADPDSILKYLLEAAKDMGGSGEVYTGEGSAEARLRLTFQTPKV